MDTAATVAPKEKFNDQVAWGNNRNLFKLYFQEIFLRERHAIATMNIAGDDFEKNIERLKNQYFNN